MTSDRLRRHIELYILVRLALATGLTVFLAALELWGEGWGDIIATGRHFQLLVGVYAVMGLSAASLLSSRRPARLAFLQILADGFIITALVTQTGGARSLFSGLFVLSVVASAYLFSRRGTLITAAIYALIVAGLGLGEGLDLMRLARGPDDLASLATGTLLKVFAFFLAAVLAGRLADELRLAGQALVRTTAQAQALEQELAQVVQVIRSGIALVGPGGALRSANLTALRLFPDLQDQPAREVIPDFNQAQDGVWEVRLKRGEGEHQILLSRSSLEDGGALLTMEDVTELRRMEREIRTQERLAAVGRFAAGIAHEVRNPLTSLSSAVQMLEVSDEDEALREIILSEVERINRLVTDFIQSAEPPRPSIRPVDMHALISEVAEAFSRDRRFVDRVSVALDLDRLGPVPCDADQVRQVLWNLVLNAAQAMPDGGTVELRLRDADDLVRIDVRDQGVGIPEGELSQVFDPFYSKRSGGTGLGLATVDRLVQAHHGRVTVDSAQGNGTRFTIWLPKTQPEEAPIG
ncbi:MAG: hypothetical protein H6741_09605 [Alphaproteobacteria bacterium]|nr:hypothetical protein [Alphaproteobacteria bacterium]MCB9792969.1 hypothetical protein [Alphaproteobacteria bacterium]